MKVLKVLKIRDINNEFNDNESIKSLKIRDINNEFNDNESVKSLKLEILIMTLMIMKA